MKIFFNIVKSDMSLLNSLILKFVLISKNGLNLIKLSNFAKRSLFLKRDFVKFIEFSSIKSLNR